MFLQWMAYLRSRVPHHKELLPINLDETSIGYAFPGAAGNITRRRWWPNKRQPPRSKVNQQAARGSITYVALVTPRGDVQRKLPQILIGSRTKRFTLRVLNSLGVIPARVFLIRGSNAWNNSVIMLEILNLLADALRDVVQGFQPVLVMDTCKCHLTDVVLHHSWRLGIWVSIVPAGLTWLLQPLDCFVFARLKSFLRNEFRACLQTHGAVSVAQWFRMLFKAATEFMCGNSWERGVRFLGLLCDRDDMSGTLLSYCPGLKTQTRAELPTVSEVAKVLPRGARVPYWLLFAGPRGFTRRLRVQ